MNLPKSHGWGVVGSGRGHRPGWLSSSANDSSPEDIRCRCDVDAPMGSGVERGVLQRQEALIPELFQ